MSGLSIWKVLTRRKILQLGGEDDSKLGRVLGPFDLTALGVGATLGVGVYVLAGNVARDQAGPSVVLSFLIAAAASFLAGLCYAEFGARVPKSGSAYIYSYVCIGEFIAFIIGWNLMLEYIIGSASVSRGLSLYLDSLLNNTMKHHFEEIAPIRWDFLSNYFDFFAFGIALLLGIALAFGLKKSTIINNVFTVLNIFIVLFVIIAGSINADIDNWKLNTTDISPAFNAGSGGFFPFGFEGTLKGAATCFFGFVGFDCIATTGEEVRNPQKSIPRAILFSLCIIFLAYFGVSTVLTLMWPYYLQDVNAPLPFVFSEIGWTFAKWVVAIGGIFGLVASLFGAMFPLPRIIYAMAQDGLIFRVLGEVSPKFKTPVFGTLTASLLTGSMAGLFDLRSLVNMLSIGTLLAYTVVAISILILRFSDHLDEKYIGTTDEESSNLMKAGNRITASTFCLQIFNINRRKRPTTVSKAVIAILVLLYCLASLCLSLTIQYAKDEINDKVSWAMTLGILFTVILLLLLLAMSLQPREHARAPFKVPLVPLLPAISIFVNIYLMLMLDMYTWIRFGIWMLIGIPMYIACILLEGKGVRNTGMLRFSKTSIGGQNNLAFIGNPKGLEDKIAYKMNKTPDSSISEVPMDQKNMKYPTPSPGIVSVIMAIGVSNDLEKMGLSERKLENGVMQNSAYTASPIANTSVPVLVAVPSTSSSDEEKSKSAPPSPNTISSVDEIVSVSEISGSLTEMKERNGTAYFIADNDHSISSNEEKETSTVLEMLDRVLEEEGDVSPIIRRNSVDSLNSVFIEDSTTVQIHQEDQQESAQISRKMESVEADDDIEKNDSNLTSVSFSGISTKRSSNEDSKSESDISIDLLVDNRAQFKKFGTMRHQKFITQLNDIIGQKANEIQISNRPKITNAVPMDDFEQRTGHVAEIKAALTTSRSVPNLQILSSAGGDEKKISSGQDDTEDANVQKMDSIEISEQDDQHQYDEKPEEENAETSIPAAPVFIPEIYNTVRSRNQITDSTLDRSVSESTRNNSLESVNIPAAPAFNPVLYNSLGPKLDSISKPISIPKVVLRKTSKDQTSAADDDKRIENESNTDEEDTSMSTLKGKLEQIYSRGPPNRLSFRPKIAKVQNETSAPEATSNTQPPGETATGPLPTATLTTTDTDDAKLEYVPTEDISNPKDTIGKQKAIFSIVLKTINSTPTPSSPVRNDIRNSFRNSSIEDNNI